VDEAPTRILRANYLVRGVAVPAGTHDVSFNYRPKSFQTGLRISALALAALAIGAIALKRSQGKRLR